MSQQLELDLLEQKQFLTASSIIFNELRRVCKAININELKIVSCLIATTYLSNYNSLENLSERAVNYANNLAKYIAKNPADLEDNRSYIFIYTKAALAEEEEENEDVMLNEKDAYHASVAYIAGVSGANIKEVAEALGAESNLDAIIKNLGKLTEAAKKGELNSASFLAITNKDLLQDLQAIGNILNKASINGVDSKFNIPKIKQAVVNR